MGKINLKGVIIGGLVAGVVLNIVDFILFTVILKDEMAAMMQAMGKPATMATGTIVWFTFVDFLFGIFLVWVYAAIRPRYGAGPGAELFQPHHHERHRWPVHPGRQLPGG